MASLGLAASSPVLPSFASSLFGSLPSISSYVKAAPFLAASSKPTYDRGIEHKQLLLQRHDILPRERYRGFYRSPADIYSSNSDYASLVAQSFFSRSGVPKSMSVREAFGNNKGGCEKGRVGMYSREGNISLASFGLKGMSKKQLKQVDITKELSRMLPYVVVATAFMALSNPSSFSWVRKDLYAPLLGGIMLSIGIQLSLSDFAVLLQKPLPLLIGYVAQYALKPLLGFALAQAFCVPAPFYAGLILTACVSGAQLSSYATYLSRGDVALSIVLTSLTTISSVIVTPVLTGFLIGSIVPVDVVGMGKSIMQVVFLPVLIGLALNTYAKPVGDLLRPLMPLLAMFCTSLCIGSPLALNRDRIVSMEGVQLLFPVLVFHAGSFLLGYLLARLPTWKQDIKVSRTLSLCTGMQSSTLAMLLATQFLGGTHAVPPACSVVVMAIMGLSLASFWGDTSTRNDSCVGQKLCSFEDRLYA